MALDTPSAYTFCEQSPANLWSTALMKSEKSQHDPAPLAKGRLLVDNGRRPASLPTIKQVTFPLNVIFDSAVRDHDVEEVAALLATLAPPSAYRERCASDSDVVDLAAKWLCPVDVNAPCKRLGLTAMHLCCLYGRLDCVRVLAAGGANCNARDKRGWTPLHVAAWAGQAHVVKFLLANGAICSVRAESGVRPIDVASKGEATVLLKEACAKLSGRNRPTPTVPAMNVTWPGFRRSSTSF